ncbi:hypothetical protein [Thioclava pacifica]|uniref:Uncharacterized protein n=1 Tax=Thioclava pacifica DSM 10166 TaxID=1353537 RepID=A0A074JQ11_9RHOB|nr:hypothetical protein [Thioclava pacifica]KEO51472.1 hypothetical protein TP2_11295 [Thioclava pacifica DSM 10166]
MRRFDPIAALVSGLLLAGAAQAGDLVAWSDADLGISAQVPQGWVSDTMPGGGVLFAAPGIDPHKAPHVALRAHADKGSDLGAAHDQLLRSILLDGDKVLSDEQGEAGFTIRSQDAFGKVTLHKTERLDCASGALLASLQTDYPAEMAAEMEPLLAPVPGSLSCR